MNVPDLIEDEDGAPYPEEVQGALADMSEALVYAQKKAGLLRREVEDAHKVIWFLVRQQGGKATITEKEVVEAPRDVVLTRFDDPANHSFQIIAEEPVQ